MSAPTYLVIPARYKGPPNSGNGGWTAGALADLAFAARVDDAIPARVGDSGRPPVEVTLRMPPPLDLPLEIVSGDDGAFVASYDGRPVATARQIDADLTPVDPVLPEVAKEAAGRYPGLASHPFPTCFACGTGRDDGLRIFPGEVTPGGVLAISAAPWTPDSSLSLPSQDDDPTASLAVTWAALDCAGAWAADFGERLMVLGRMTARIDALPRIGEEHVVVGEARGVEGRKTFSATSLYDADLRLVGTAEQVWIAVDPADFR